MADIWKQNLVGVAAGFQEAWACQSTSESEDPIQLASDDPRRIRVCRTAIACIHGLMAE